MSTIKIKATYRFCRGIGSCTLCPEYQEDPEVLYTYGGADDIEGAERLLYEEMFDAERESQNGRYRKKGNYGRIWTMDEWRRSVRHRPIENVLFVGNEDCYFYPDALFDAYLQFCEKREERFGNIFLRVSALRYAGSTIPHIHERYVLFWTDAEGIKHTEIDKALEQAGVAVPFPEKEEGQYNNRKMMFDSICREMWLDIAAGVLEDEPDVELERPKSGFRSPIRVDRNLRLSSGDRRALGDAWVRNGEKINVLKDKIKGMETELADVRTDIEIGDGNMDALKERMLVLKNKIADYKKRLIKTEEKSKAIREAIY